MKILFAYTFDMGKIYIAQSGEALTNVLFDRGMPPNCPLQESPLLKEAARQLEAYFRGRLRTFDLPLAPYGTEFQQRVWKALRDIPYGETRSYKEVAAALGQPQAARAVGMANNKNPIGIIIPCHRVIGASGHLVGYAGGLRAKARLLELERAALARSTATSPIMASPAAPTGTE